ncbi:MAG: lytic murein transglycosylase [Gammaproteobacteria bacterium]|nr:lytic murein transglycosylase [Gammaproteobacteria bacterium]
MNFNLAILFLVLLVPAFASGDYSENEKAKALIDGLVNDLDFDRQALESVFREAKHVPQIIEIMNRPAESLYWREYKEIFLQPERIEAGIAFVKDNSEDLKRAEETYGVAPHIISAIIGVETYYGKFLGKYRVIDALVTLGFGYPRRAEFFSEELRHFMILACEERIKPFDRDESCHRMNNDSSSGNGRSIDELVGSYAGAMGYGQFISSSYRNFAVDFDGDGIRDIWTNTTDAIGSVANYFAEHGWIPDAAILERVSVESDESQVGELANEDLKPNKTVSEWRSLGINSESEDDSLAALFAFRLDDENGVERNDYVLGFDNFYVITRYNISRLYARVVYQLAMDIQNGL